MPPKTAGFAHTIRRAMRSLLEGPAPAEAHASDGSLREPFWPPPAQLPKYAHEQFIVEEFNHAGPSRASERLLAGIDQQGYYVRMNHELLSHTLVIGAPGTGKTVFIDSIVRQIREMDAEVVHISEGQVPYDIETHHETATATTKRVMQSMRKVKRILKKRMSAAVETDDSFVHEPLFLIIDSLDYATSNFTPEDAKEFYTTLESILAYGRHFRVYCMASIFGLDSLELSHRGHSNIARFVHFRNDRARTGLEPNTAALVESLPRGVSLFTTADESMLVGSFVLED